MLTVLSACDDGSHRDAKPPSLLLISIDTLRADHLAVYGYGRETSPALSRFATGGVRWASSYSQAPSTVPTHASMFTGRLPFEHGTFSHGQRLADAELTLAEHLAAHGYRTFAAASSVRFNSGAGFDQGFDRYLTLFDLDKNLRSAAVTDFALEQLEAADRPVFGFLHYFDPHEPYAPPEPWRSRFHSGRPPSAPAPEETSPYLQAHNSPHRRLPDGVLAYLEGLYDGGILHLDGELERLFTGLRALGREADTVVIVTSDHGEEFKEHGGLSHSNRLHQEVLRVPLLMRWPGRLPAGAVVERPAQTVDLFPTVCELLEVPCPPDLAGRSLAGEARRRTGAPATDDLIFVQQNDELWGVIATLAAGRLKLTVDGDRVELYDLDADPQGLVDVRADHPEAEAELRRLVRALRARAGGRGPTATERGPLSQQERERLRSLGYLGNTPD